MTILLCKVALRFLGFVCGHLSRWGYVTKVWSFVYKNIFETLKQMRHWNCQIFGSIKGMLLRIKKVLMSLGLPSQTLLGCGVMT